MRYGIFRVQGVISCLSHVHPTLYISPVPGTRRGYNIAQPTKTTTQPQRYQFSL